ncbi:(deoxy)nucleoside triphosphate pyrophosphohydrolase [Bacillus sp. S13(2024)]|uniref:(deoxy)nucleoside triphosphate pyrophosphohydrolase n=1 Tax=unclassified Bacillus (in: firmicutes) TaxID=185979 RepID=UPI003D1CE8C2
MKKITVVGAVIQNKQKQILCALRSQDMTLPNYWEFPGGKVEKEEDHKQALIREIKEELDCIIQVNEKITEVTHEYENIIVNLHTYWCELISGSPQLKEHEKIEWLGKNEIVKLNWAHADIPTVNLITR